jgi:PPOX class probable F420-dependent enzyme
VTNNDLRDALHQMLTAADGGVLAPLKRDGRPQLINVNHHYDPAERVIRFSISDGDAKTSNLRRDPRASYHVTSPDRSAYTVAEGTAALTPVATGPHDPVVDEHISLYRAMDGEHPDWDKFRLFVVSNRQLVLSLTVERLYGIPQE